MKCVLEAWLVGSILISGAYGQDPQKIVLREGISVQMAAASHAVETRAADNLNATVVAIAADGKVFVGTKATEPEALSHLSEETVYVKADSRVAYQSVLTVLDALRGKSVVLLTAPPGNAVKQGIAQPYGMALTISR